MRSRKATKKDFPKLAELMKDFWNGLNSRTKKQFEKAYCKELKDPAVERFLFFEKDELVGNLTLVKYVMTHTRGYLVILEEIIINKKFRRKGYGLKLLQFAVDYAKKLKAGELWLETGKDNKLTQTFYSKKLKRDPNALIYKLKL